MNRLSSCAAAGALLLVFGCRRDDTIVTYRVPKEIQPAMPMSAPNAEPRETKPRGLSWTVPEGWKEQAPSAMRLASFLVNGKDGRDADVSIIMLGGEAGGDLANINRWRGQINLDPLPASELASQVKEITPGGRKMHLVNFVSKENLIGNKYKKRLVAAIYQQGSRSWFFKMAGDDQTVDAATADFLQFLKSLHFPNGQ